MWRKTLKLSVAQAALCCSCLSAHAQTGEIVPLHGDLTAFGSDINAFHGDINAFSGDLNPFAGDIYAFYGDISPFWGDISPFWGDINPFQGDINAFSGDINAFSGDIHAFSGDINAFAGDLHPFWGDINPFANVHVVHDGGLSGYWQEAGREMGRIMDLWSNAVQTGAQSDLDYTMDRLQHFVRRADQVWEPTWEAQTGKRYFQSNFLRPLLAEYGVDWGDEQDLLDIDAATLSAFFLDYYASVMMFSGMDIPDHWMPLVNWSPLITQQQGFGQGSSVGLLDGRIDNQAGQEEFHYLKSIGGFKSIVSNHGAAVASLIASRHDGRGVMGIAPRATVYSYNPFDQSGTASDTDIQKGFDKLVKRGASVINMSLGVPGSTFDQTMADVLADSSLTAYRGNTIAVTAAGNDGITQTADVEWGAAGLEAANLIIVGSVDINGQISSFSNRPGEACFTTGGNCAEGNKLKDRFIVAPGELLLVSDNNGGVTHATGTSFAAPLVTGTIALLHDRWPWLQEHPHTTAEIVLSTAKDLGANGTDSTYGRGLLDVTASQSPIDFDNLEFWYFDENSSGQTSAQDVANAIVTTGALDLFEASQAFIVAFEHIDSTYRDFAIPLSSIVQSANISINGNSEAFQSFVAGRLIDWAEGVGTNGGETDIFDDFAGTQSFSQDVVSYRQFGKGRVEMLSGAGVGAQNLTIQAPNADAGDFDVYLGGTNPLLGLATGGAFGRMSLQATPNLTMSVAMSSTAFDQRITDAASGQRLIEDPILGSRDARATMVELAYQVNDKLRIGTSLTNLREDNAILGSQGGGALSIEGGSQTAALGLSAVYTLTDTVDLSASMTAGRTFDRSGVDSILGVSDGGLVSTAFQVSATFRDLGQTNDRLSLSFAQPLHIEQGSLEMTTATVVDRATGALSNETTAWELGTSARHFAGEAEYSFPALSDRTRIGLFTRYDQNVTGFDGLTNAVSAGARVQIKF